MAVETEEASLFSSDSNSVAASSLEAGLWTTSSSGMERELLRCFLTCCTVFWAAGKLFFTCRSLVDVVDPTSDKLPMPPPSRGLLERCCWRVSTSA